MQQRATSWPRVVGSCGGKQSSRLLEHQQLMREPLKRVGQPWGTRRGAVVGHFLLLAFALRAAGQLALSGHPGPERSSLRFTAISCYGNSGTVSWKARICHNCNSQQSLDSSESTRQRNTAERHQLPRTSPTQVIWSTAENRTRNGLRTKSIRAWCSHSIWRRQW